MTDAERQTAYHESIWKPAQRKRTEYWQSMWERSMHNPLNKKPAVHHGDVDEFTRPGILPPVKAEPEYAASDFNWPSSPRVIGPEESSFSNPRNTPPPRTAWSKAPWPDVRGTPNAPCCKAGPLPYTFSDEDMSVLTEAQSLVYGDRQRSYGHPAVDFARTAALANVLLASKLSKDLGPEDVALFMVAVKLSRECHEPARDNLVDAAGYLECRARVLRFLGTASERSKDAR